MKRLPRSFQEFLERKRCEYGSKFDSSDLAPEFIPFYESQQRIKVDFGDIVLTGTVGVTTGWKPIFLLMRTSRSVGSIYTLSSSDHILTA